MKIKLLTSMIFDAICACNFIEDHGPYSIATQNEVLETLKQRTAGAFRDGTLSYSTLCGIVAKYLPDPSTADLHDLYQVFVSIDDVDKAIREKEMNEFTRSYILPNLDLLKNEYAEKYCKYITALKEAGFEELWREKILPVEKEQIDKMEAAFQYTDIDKILALISQMKGTHCDSVTTYISLMSYPVAFTLGTTVFLDTIHNKDEYYQNGFLSMIAHELMHGFASSRLTQLYQDFMSHTRYLSSTHTALLDDMRSGDEEEFVMAAEYYIMWRSGTMTKKDIILKNYFRYGGCVPLALYIFDYMTKEPENIENYDQWLIKGFENGDFLPEDVGPTIDAMLPKPDNYDNFYANLFVILQRCSYIIRDAQIHFQGDIKKQIEALTGARFVPNGNKSVSFAEGENEIGENAVWETLVSGNLTVDRIAFDNKKDALTFRFPCGGANISPHTVEYEGESITKPYILNLAFHKDRSNRAEFSFVCGSARYLITSVCGDGVTDIDTDEDPDATYRAYGQEMLDAVRKAEDIVMLLV